MRGHCSSQGECDCAPEAPVKPIAPPYSFGSAIWPGLTKLVEETGEVGQVIGKLMGTGGAPEHWDGGPPLNLRLEEEIADTIAAAYFVMTHNKLDKGRIAERIGQKSALFEAWHTEHSQ